jgi:hypothetical protein
MPPDDDIGAQHRDGMVEQFQGIAGLGQSQSRAQQRPRLLDLWIAAAGSGKPELRRKSGICRKRLGAQFAMDEQKGCENESAKYHRKNAGISTTRERPEHRKANQATAAPQPPLAGAPVSPRRSFQAFETPRFCRLQEPNRLLYPCIPLTCARSQE